MNPLRLTLALFSLLLPSFVLAGDDASELAKHLPKAANTIEIVRMSSIFKTDRAQSEKWYERSEKRFLSGSGIVPHWVETLVVGSLVHPAASEHVWSAAVMHIPKTVTIESIAKNEGVSVEKLAGVPAVRGQFDNYIALPSPGLVISYRPAHRQEVSRWIRSITKKQKAELSPYLVKAASKKGHIVLAIDLKDLINEKIAEKNLMEDERFASRRKLIKRLTKLLGGIHGITLAVMIDKTTKATITIDFSQEVGALSIPVRTLLIAALNDMGAPIDELSSSKLHTVGNSVVLTFKLSDESLRRIFSLVVPFSSIEKVSSQTEKIHKPQIPQKVLPADPDKETRRYLESVNKMLDDLKKAYKRKRTYKKTAFWHEKFARRIMRLSRKNVDRKALKYGKSIASKLRALSASLHGESITVNAEQRTLTYNVNYDPGWGRINVWGGYGYRQPTYRVQSNLREVRKKQAEAVIKGAKERIQIWRFMDEERDVIEQKWGRTDQKQQ